MTLDLPISAVNAVLNALQHQAGYAQELAQLISSQAKAQVTPAEPPAPGAPE